MMNNSKFCKQVFFVSYWLWIAVSMHPAQVLGLFTSAPPIINGVVNVCVDDRFSLTCVHSNINIGITRWVFSMIDCPSISHSPPITRPDCHPFVFSNISTTGDGVLYSTASATANALLNGTDVECRDSAGNSPNVIGHTTICVIDRSSLPVPANATANVSSISWDVPSTYIDNNVISFYIEIMGSSGQTVYDDFVVNTSIPTPVAVLSEGQNYTVSVRSAVNGSCMSNATKMNFLVPPTKSGIGGSSRFPEWLIALIVVVILAIFAVIVVVVYLSRRHYNTQGRRKIPPRLINRNNVAVAPCATMPTRMDEVQCTTVGGKVYIQGATEHDDHEFNIYCYNPVIDAWNTLPVLPVKYCGLGNYNNRLVVVGGIKQDKEVSDDVYTFENDQWNGALLPKLEVARHSSCVLSFSSHLAVAGGKTKSELEQYTCNVEIYDQDHNKWYSTIPLPKSCDISSIVIENKAIIIGRANSKSVFFVTSEDLERGKEYGDDERESDTRSFESLPTWKALGETPMELPGAATLGHNLLTVGGRIDGKTISQMYAYDLKKRKWRHTEGIDLPRPLLGCGICSFSPNEFYVIGGCRDSSESGESDDSSYPKVNTVYKYTLSSE